MFTIDLLFSVLTALAAVGSKYKSLLNQSAILPRPDADSIKLRGIRIVRDIWAVSSNVNAQYVDGKNKGIN